MTGTTLRSALPGPLAGFKPQSRALNLPRWRQAATQVHLSTTKSDKILDPAIAKPTPLSATLTLLGHSVAIPQSPEEAVLERVPNPHPDANYLARFTAPEFTSLCAVTGQPDFAHMVIDYVPDAWLVESKALKLYLTGFRNHGAFHEDCTLRIGKDLVKLLAPRWLRIGAYWYPRGGMPIDVFWQTGPVPDGLWLQDQGVAPYRGRG